MQSSSYSPLTLGGVCTCVWWEIAEPPSPGGRCRQDIFCWRQLSEDEQNMGGGGITRVLWACCRKMQRLNWYMWKKSMHRNNEHNRCFLEAQKDIDLFNKRFRKSAHISVCITSPYWSCFYIPQLSGNTQRVFIWHAGILVYISYLIFLS